VKSVTLKNDEPLTVVSCGSMDKVKAVLPNYNDYSFLRIELDKPSIDFFMQTLKLGGNLQLDTLNSLILWNAMYHMMTECKLKQ
jgi:hypothetical protein